MSFRPLVRDDLALMHRWLNEPHVARWWGEASFLYRGLGGPLVRQFVHEVIFADTGVTTCFIDPEGTNATAIRAYEKAGFRFVRDVMDDGEGATVHLMEMPRLP
jgi:RimJ/RimL family protein N-acetyltransferase